MTANCALTSDTLSTRCLIGDAGTRTQTCLWSGPGSYFQTLWFPRWPQCPRELNLAVCLEFVLGVTHPSVLLMSGPHDPIFCFLFGVLDTTPKPKGVGRCGGFRSVVLFAVLCC